jgi:hypothetical protein
VPNPGFQIFMKGANRVIKETEAIEARVNKATVMAVKENQRILKLAIRRKLRGAPRWNQRGAVGKSPAINVGGPRHRPRSGPPGRLTGALYKGVGGRRRPLLRPGGVVIGGVGIGGNINLLKKGKLEEEFPFFKPAVQETEPKMARAYEKGWDKAVNKMGGIV